MWYLLYSALLLLIHGYKVSCLNVCQQNGCSACVYVSATSSQNSCKQCADGWCCPSLFKAFTISDLNNTCIIMNETQSLTTQISRNYVWNLAIFGLSQPTIECTNSGFSFQHSKNITFKDLIFDNCGRNVASTAYDTRTHQSIPATISSALYFNDVEDITIANVQVKNSRGYGIFVLDCVGNINIQRLTVQNNSLVSMQNLTSGGGIVFQHLSIQKELTSTIHLHACTFQGLTSSSTNADWIRPFAHGGGISVLLLGKTRENQINIQESNFTDNSALSGGGLYIENGLHSTNNTIQIQSCSICRNHANWGGGVYYYSLVEPSHHNNSLKVYATTFESNAAIEGVGGAFVYRNEKFHPNLHPANVSTVISQADFRRNEADLGSAIYLHDCHILFKETVLVESNSLTKGLAAIYVYKSDLIVENRLNIWKNKKTGLLLDYSKLYIQQTVNVRGNQGVEGGGIALYENSQIFFSDTAELLLTENHANRGGGIYIKLSGTFFIWNSQELNIYECYFKPINRTSKYPGNITFSNNAAIEDDGNDIFTTSLQPCLKYKQTIFDWVNFHGLTRSSVTTDPVKMTVANRDEWNKIYPGKHNSLGLIVTDELGNNVSAVVTMKISDPKIYVKHDYEQFIVSNNMLQEFVLLGTRYKPFEVEFTLSSGKAQPLVLPINLTNCPFGYAFVDSQNGCICENLRNSARGITQCKKEEIYVLANMWAKGNQQDEKTDTETLQHCPEGFCRECNDLSAGENYVQCKFNVKNQCRQGRDQNSLLCSRCEKNLSVTYGSVICTADCANCSYKIMVPVVTVGIFLGTFLVVFVSLLLDMGVYENYLSSIFFFYQVVGLFFTSTQTFDGSMKIVTGVINVDLPLRICVDKDFSDLWKPLLSLWICICVILSLIIVQFVGNKLFQCVMSVVILCKCFKIKKFDYFRKEYSCRALVFFVFWTYSRITQIAMQLLHPVKIDHSWRSYDYADLGYFENWQRKFLFSVGLLLALSIVVVFPILLLISDYLKKWKGLQELAVVFDMFKIHFKNDWVSQAFSAYYLIWRLIFICVRAFLTSSPNQVVLTVLTCLSVVMFILFALQNPYKDRKDYVEESNTGPRSGKVGYIDNNPYYLNYFDTIVLSVLCAVGIVSNGRQKLSVKDHMDGVLRDVVNVLTWIPFVIFVFVVLCKFWQRRKLFWKFLKTIWKCICCRGKDSYERIN